MSIGSFIMPYLKKSLTGSTVGSSPTWGANEVIAMRGSRVAKQILFEQRRDAKRKEIALKLREAMRRRRGESNGERTESKTD